MSSPEKLNPSDKDILVSGVECAQTNQTVCYFYYQYQASVVAALVVGDARANRICKSCADQVIDNISYAVGEKL